MAASATLGAGLDWKTSLQELSAATAKGVPEYRVDEEGPDHEKTFHARAVVGDEVLGSGTGRSKKEAEQRAAELAWRALTARAADPAGIAGAPAAADEDAVAGSPS
jgi:ribonuclease-3